MYFTSNSETPHELWINISIYQIHSRCFNRGRYLAGVFLPAYVPLPAIGNESVPAMN